MKKNNEIYIMIITLIVVLILIISSLYLYFGYFTGEEKVETEPVVTIGNEIDPLTNQAIFFHIHRIRKKGIIDKLYNAGSPLDYSPRKTSGGADVIHKLEGIRPGFGWDEKPIFNYICILDGYIHTGDVDFKCWDTGYINHCFFRNVEENLSTADVEFKIIQVNYNKLKDTRSTKEVENFKFIYDFRDGTWSGEDSFNDTDGYGHINTSNYEIWFKIGQTDFDDDGIPWRVEKLVLGTNPMIDDSKLDPDEDGIPTDWEWRWGYDPFTKDNHSVLDPDNDGLENIEEWLMSKWQANPFQPEMYIEVDWMEKSPFKLFEIEMKPGIIFKSLKRPRIVISRLDGWEHILYEESQQMIIERFNEHGITVHFDDGCMGGGGDILPFAKANYETADRIYLEHALRNQDNGLVSEFYYNNFADERKGIFRYCVIAHGGGWCHPQDIGHGYDYLVVPTGKEFNKISMGCAWAQRTRRIALACGVFHELGHSCGLHGFDGIDNCTAKAGNPPDYPWWDYLSVMNYDYYMQRYFDYSHGKNGGKYDQDDWEIIDISHFQGPSEYMEGVGAGVVFE
ncbi:MAG: hypothetical protein JXA91_00670 [Candidatus Thermoplasmatota archaeon]|nr:hypothetical protein [Candidatus Thermoplasmatota archaeon]